MKHLLLCFIVIATTTNLKAEDDLFSMGAKLHFVNKIDLSKRSNKKYVRYTNPSIFIEAHLKSKLSDTISFDSAFTSSKRDSCLKSFFVKKAKLSLSFHELFSVDAGCLRLEQGSWASRLDDDFSVYDTSLNHHFWNGNYNKAINLNLNFMGAIKLQIIEDMVNENKHTMHGIPDQDKPKLGQVALNTAWVMDLFGTQPIFQLGFYNKFRAFHYSLGIKGELEGFHYAMTFTRDHFKKTVKTTNTVTEVENIQLKYAAHQLINPFARYQHKKVTFDDKTVENMGSPYENKSWSKGGGYMFSFGNEFLITDHVSSYLNISYRWGTFSPAKKEKKWDIRLGVKGQI